MYKNNTYTTSSHCLSPCSFPGVMCMFLMAVLFSCDAIQAQDIRIEQSISEGPVVIDSIQFKGNDQTRRYLLFKEMSIHPGDTIERGELPEMLRHNEDRLLNTGLFNKATIYLHSYDPESRKVTLLVELTEAWYIYPIPIVELADRNFNVWWEEYNRDLDRLNLGMKLYYSNVSGQNDRIKAIVQAGFTKKFELEYQRPFLGPQTNWGMDMNALFTTGKEIAAMNSENKPVFLRDEDDPLLQRIQGGMTGHWRPNPYLSMKTGLKYYHWGAGDKLLDFNPEYLNGFSDMRFIRLTHEWSWDHRDRKIYPRDGLLLRGTVEKWGLGIWDQLDRWSFSAAVQRYFELSEEWSIGGGLKVKHFADNQQLPYRLNTGLGYGEDFIRGYERVVVDGTTFALAKSEVKFKVAKFSLNLGSWVPMDNMEIVPLAFYLSGALEAGWAYDPARHGPSNNLVGDMLVGTGLGLDVLLYENYLFSIDFSTTKHGYGGVFLHSGIVFD